MKQELIEWMDLRKLSAEDVGARLDVSAQTIRNWRSSGVPPRKIDALRKCIAEWDRTTSTLGSIIIRPTYDQFRNWNHAALHEGKLIEDWAKDGLDQLAAEHETQLRLVAEDPHPYTPKNKNSPGK